MRAPGRVAGPVNHDFGVTVDLKPGVYDVQALVHRASSRNFAPFLDSPQTAEVVAQFEVISPDGEDTVRLITTTDARKDLQSSLGYMFTPVRLVDDAGNSRSVQEVSFRALWPPPIGIACDVFAFDGFQEREAGQLWCAPGSARPVFDCCPTLDIEEPANTVFILRPNPDIARRTVDIFEIFGGEIVLGPAQPHIYDPEASP